MRLILSISLCLLLVNCEAFISTKGSKNIDLVEAKKIWNSNNIQSYTFDYGRTCECLNPYNYSVEVVDGKINAVIFEKLDYLSYDSEEMIIQSTWTIDELFDLLEQYEKTADYFEVSFQQEYGYPTKITIDPYIEMADEEIILEISNLVRVIN